MCNYNVTVILIALYPIVSAYGHTRIKVEYNTVHTVTSLFFPRLYFQALDSG